MATASRTRPSGAAKSRNSTPRVGTILLLDAIKAWAVPVATGGGLIAAAGASATGLVETAPALVAAICCGLLLLLYLGLQPMLTHTAPRRAQGMAAVLAAVWFAGCLYPFAARLLPGAPLLEATEVAPGRTTLPLAIPAHGRRALDLLIEGTLGHAATGPAIPVQYSLTIEDAGGAVHTIAGRFDETLKSQRLGRRGSTVVHQTHSHERHVLANPAGGDLRITAITLQPLESPPLALRIHPHPLPPPLLLAPAALALLAAVLAFDRTAAMTASDGALTLATTSVLGAAVVFWTSNTAHPDFSTLIGSTIFGGPAGFGAGALVWWIAKRFLAHPAKR